MKIRSLAEDEVKSIAFMLDKENGFPTEVVNKLGEMAMMGIPYEKKYGGAGLDVISYAIAVEELSRVYGGTGVNLSAHTSLGLYPIAAYGTEEQKQKYLVPLAKGERIGAFIVEKDWEGSTFGEHYDKLGIRSSYRTRSCSMYRRNCSSLSKSKNYMY